MQLSMKSFLNSALENNFMQKNTDRKGLYKTKTMCRTKERRQQNEC